MNAVVIVFMVIATVFALATLTYVGIDIAQEKKGKNNDDIPKV